MNKNRGQPRSNQWTKRQINTKQIQTEWIQMTINDRHNWTEAKHSKTKTQIHKTQHIFMVILANIIFIIQHFWGNMYLFYRFLYDIRDQEVQIKVLALYLFHSSSCMENEAEYASKPCGLHCAVQLPFHFRICCSGFPGSFLLKH